MLHKWTQQFMPNHCVKTMSALPILVILDDNAFFTKTLITIPKGKGNRAILKIPIFDCVINYKNI